MKQPKLTAIIQSCRLTLFGHIMRMDDNADAKRILLASFPANWRRQLGRPRVAQHCPTGSETTPPHASRSSRFGLEPPSVEDDVDVWCYAVLELHARNDDNDAGYTAMKALYFYLVPWSLLLSVPTGAVGISFALQEN